MGNGKDLFEAQLEEELLELSSSGRLPQAFFEAIDLDKTHLDASILRIVGGPGDSAFERPTAASLADDFQAERIVRAFKRPSLLVAGNSFESTASEVWSHTLETHRSAIETSLPAVGRIEVKNHSNLDWVGTGFLVAPDVLVTNRHVAREFARRHGSGFNWRRNHRGKLIQPRVDFREEHRQPEEEEFDIVEVLHLAPPNAPDMALLRLESPSSIAPLALEENLGIVEFVGAIGYPWRDSRVESHLIEAMERIFKGIFDVKRFAPGRLIPTEGEDLGHDCTTLGGNSGSAIIDLASGAAVGVHYGGYSDLNVAVPARVIREALEQL
ncbi:MAG: serine protease [Acidobacteriota bacterium]